LGLSNGRSAWYTEPATSKHEHWTFELCADHRWRIAITYVARPIVSIASLFHHFEEEKRFPSMPLEERSQKHGRSSYVAFVENCEKCLDGNPAKVEITPFVSDLGDNSEFPSLSSGPAQTQQQNSAWGLRNVSQNAPLPQSSAAPRLPKPLLPQNLSLQPTQPSTQASQPQQQQRTATQDSSSSTFPTLRSGSEEYRLDNEGNGIDPPQATEQPRGPDDFPPLGGMLGQDIIQVRHLGQNAQLNGLGGNDANVSVLGNAQRNGTANESTSIGGSSPSTTSADKTRSPATNNSHGTELSPIHVLKRCED